MDYFSIATMDYFSIGIYNVIRSLTDNCNDKKERSDNEIAPLSHLVGSSIQFSNTFIEDILKVYEFAEKNSPCL